MPKTKEIVIIANKVNVETNWNKDVLITLKQPVIHDLLASIDMEDIKDFVRNNKLPDELFDENELEKWAEDNGYVKK